MEMTVTEKRSQGDGSDDNDTAVRTALYVTSGLVALMAIIMIIIICRWVRSKYSGQSTSVLSNMRPAGTFYLARGSPLKFFSIDLL